MIIGVKATQQKGHSRPSKQVLKILNLDEIVSFTATQNHRSQAVMQKIGMHSDPNDDFDHPKLDVNHRLSRHVLYRLKRDEWKKSKAQNTY